MLQQSNKFLLAFTVSVAAVLEWLRDPVLQDPMWGPGATGSHPAHRGAALCFALRYRARQEPLWACSF